VTATPRAIELLQIAARAADDKQADDLVALDVSGPLPLTDVFLLATGRSERNVVAIAGEIEDKMLEAGVVADTVSTSSGIVGQSLQRRSSA
jgi:ribosome-associated protein